MKKVMKQVIGISILLLGASFVMSFLSCGDKGKGGGATVLKKFDVKYIKVWDKDVKSKATETVSGSAKEKTLEVQVDNCNRYTMVYKVDGVAGTPIEADAGNAVAKPFDIAKDASIRLVVTLKADGFEEFSYLVKITRQDTSASGVKVLLKRAEDTASFEVANGRTYETANDKATVVVTSEKAVMKTVKIAGSDITPTDAGKKAEKTDVATGNVEVSVQFDDYKPYTFSFTLKKVDSASDVSISANSAIVYSGDNYGNSHVLEFNENREATVELDDVQYSLVKLEMKMDSTLDTSSGLEECKDERSANYKTQPNENDIKGIFSGRLKAEIDLKGNKTDFTSVKSNIFTEYLIVGAGTVEYKFKFKSTNRKDTEYTVKITNTKQDKVVYGGQEAHFYNSHGYGSQKFLSGPPVWRWTTYSMLPINSDEAFKKVADVEYMGDNVKMLFAKINAGISGEMYFYYNIFEDENSKKHEFVRQIGKDQGKAYFTLANFDPEQKYVDAFVGFKDFLPQALLPLQLKNKWKKIVEKGFLIQVENNLKYKDARGNEESSLDIFYDIFNYRVQAKTYAETASDKKILKIGLKQKYKDMLGGNEGNSNDKPFLQGGKEIGKDADLFIMIPTFGGNMQDSIESFTYKIQKCKAGQTDEYEDCTGFENVTLTPAKWPKFFCLNAKSDENINNNGQLVKEKMGEMFKFEKGENGSENIYKIEVTVKTKTSPSTEQKFIYKINYKTEETLDLMDLSNEPSVDSSLFGVPTSYAECVNREAQAMFKEIMAEEFAREKLLNR